MPFSNKYGPLRAHLEKQVGAEYHLTFAQIEKLTGHTLPESSRLRRWWANNAQNRTQARAWLEAGWRVVKVDFAGRRVRFVRRG